MWAKALFRELAQTQKALPVRCAFVLSNRLLPLSGLAWTNPRLVSVSGLFPHWALLSASPRAPPYLGPLVGQLPGAAHPSDLVFGYNV